MTHKIIDNVLSQEHFNEIKNIMLNKHFSWHLISTVTHKQENLSTVASYCFVHMFWDGFYTDSKVTMFQPLLEILDCKAVIRIKGNLFPSTETVIRHDNHVDYPYPHRGAIFYLNTNNGLTILEDKIEVKSVENRLLIFDSSKTHCSTTCSDERCRINVNFNFF